MRMVSVFAVILGLLLISPCLHAYSVEPSAEGAQVSMDQMLSIAEKQHDIAMLLIKEGRFDRVLPEMRKIFALNLQGEHEQPVAKSASFIAYLLAENKQYPLGHELLDEAIVKMQQPENVALLLKTKALIFKSQGKLREAIETLERSVQIEKQGISQ
jgi:tetratricopeptide (TPR) repeat protein